MAALVSDLPRVRILVVGDSGVGKSSLVHLLCHGEAQGNPSATVGCRTDVRLHHTRVDGQDQRFFVEFWEVGGHRNFKMGRGMFYRDMNGILFVHDLKNRKSFVNLRNWLNEILAANRVKSVSEAESNENGSSRNGRHRQQAPTDSRLYYGNYSASLGFIPMLIVGNKADLIRGSDLSIPNNSVKTYGIDSVNLSSLRAETEKLNPFLQTVIETRHFPHLRKRVHAKPSEETPGRANDVSVFVAE